MPAVPNAARRPLIAVSSCLLGEAVRYDGGHKRDSWITGPLSRHLDYRPICPEVAIGLGVPRPPIHLTGAPQRPRAVGVQDPSLDVTAALQGFARHTARELQGVAGYILKSRSPSCGMARVKLHGQHGARQTTVGIHAREIMARLPQLPVEEEGRLNDPLRRENFITRVYTYHRWLVFRRQRLSARGLLAFHTAHKYLVMAHNQAAYRRLGKLLADLKGVQLPAIAEQYIAELMGALGRCANRAHHVNVLQHITGYLKRRLDGDDKQALVAAIAAYGRGEVPLIVPLFLLRHHLRQHPDPYLAGQWYLNPYPDALGLRNHI
jgi:uncharacterized protein YbgA (DUF1722 family)/uncharacterized protein YbbK (DUF523 family)